MTLYEITLIQRKQGVVSKTLNKIVLSVNTFYENSGDQFYCGDLKIKTNSEYLIFTIGEKFDMFGVNSFVTQIISWKSKPNFRVVLANEMALEIEILEET
jgi:hypothetical protein